MGCRESAEERLHGISFDMAQEVFDPPNHGAAENYFIEIEGEQSYQIISKTRNLVLLRGEEIRIISARKAVD
jgi:uncharacterized DUF497 family protein